VQSLAVDGYSRLAVIAALHATVRETVFEYELLDQNNETLGLLDSVSGGSIKNNSLATNANRTAKFSISDQGVNYLSDRIRPWMKLRMPDGGHASWPLGVFILSSPSRVIRSAGEHRKVEAYDQRLILLEDREEDRYVITSGTNFVTAINTILDSAGVTEHAIIATDKMLPASRDWKAGTPKLRIINDLLGSINYSPLNFSSAGIALSRPYQRPSERAPGYEYAATDDSILSPDLSIELDSFGVANKWVATVSEADRLPLTSVYTNVEPSSPTSTVSRGRTIVDFRSVDAADQESLDAIVARIAFEASQLYEKVELETALMPHHENNEVVQVTYPRAGISAKYTEHKWSLPLQAGAGMKHTLRRVVTV